MDDVSQHEAIYTMCHDDTGFLHTTCKTVRLFFFKCLKQKQTLTMRKINIFFSLEILNVKSAALISWFVLFFFKSWNPPYLIVTIVMILLLYCPIALP